MKRLFTLIILLSALIGAKAELVEDYKITYSSYSGFPFFVMGYVPEWVNGVMTDRGADYRYATDEELEGYAALQEGESIVGTVTTNNGTVYNKILCTYPSWHQYSLATNIPTEMYEDYTVKAMVKASEPCTVIVNMQWGWMPEQIISCEAEIGTEWQEVEWNYPNIQGEECQLIAQPGAATATIQWKYVTVSHNPSPNNPEWIEHVVNGDASGEYGYPACAQYLNVPYDMVYNGFTIDEMASKVEPAEIVTLSDGGKAFKVHTPAVDKSAYTTDKNGNDISDSYAWANQFFIVSNDALRAGDIVKVSFDYKATEPATANTEAQGMPAYYHYWQMLGDVEFTTEWQHFEKEVTIFSEHAGADGMYSIAFNLNPDNQDENVFLFKNLSIRTKKVERGYFVASSSVDNSIRYDFDRAVSLERDPTTIVSKAVVGTVGDRTTWVDEIMISTVRGDHTAFKSNTLKPRTALVAGEWISCEVSPNAKIKLPAAGVWEISLNEDSYEVCVRQIEGEEIPTPIEIVPNPTKVVANAAERDYTSAEAPEGYEFPMNSYGEPITGNPWDNQLIIMANRPLREGEVTVVEFDYSATSDATTNTQCGGDSPGSYVHWSCLGDIDFSTAEQHFEKEFVVPSDIYNAVQSITFNLSVIKDANQYTIKNVVWKTADNSESLIDMEGAKNFYVKEGVSTLPAEYIPVTDVSEYDDILYVDTVEARPGRQIEVPVKLKNLAAVQSLGVHVKLPEGIRIAKDAAGQDMIRLSSMRTDAGTHSISSNYVDGEYRIAILGHGGRPFGGNDGEIFTIVLDVPYGLPNGKYPIEMTEMEIVDVMSSVSNVAHYYSVITLDDYVDGDANGDGEVSMADANMVINRFLGKNSKGIVVKAADMNGDGKITMVDANIIVNMYLQNY